MYNKILFFFRMLFAHRSFGIRRTGHDESQFRGRICLPDGRLWTNACVSVFLDIHIDTQTVTGGYNMSEFRQICRRGVCRRLRLHGLCSKDRRSAVYLWVQAKCNPSSLCLLISLFLKNVILSLDTRYSFTLFSPADFFFFFNKTSWRHNTTQLDQ